MKSSEPAAFQLLPHCGRCGSLLVGRYCGFCGQSVPEWPASGQPFAWLQLPTSVESRWHQLTATLLNWPGYQEEVWQDDVLHSLPLPLVLPAAGKDLAASTRQFFEWPGAVIKTYSGFRICSGTPVFAAFVDYLYGQPVTAAALGTIFLERAAKWQTAELGSEGALLALTRQLASCEKSEWPWFLLPQFFEQLQAFLRPMNIEATAISHYLSPAFLALGASDKRAYVIKQHANPPPTRIIPLNLARPPRQFALLAYEAFLTCAEDEWYLNLFNECHKLSLPGEVQHIWPLNDATTLLTIKTANNCLPMVLRTILPTVERSAATSLYELLPVGQNENYKAFEYDTISGRLWVLYNGGHLISYDWNTVRQTYIAAYSWEIEPLAAAAANHHPHNENIFMSLVPEFLLVRESGALVLYHFKNRTKERVLLSLQLIDPWLLGKTPKGNLLLLDDRRVLFELHVSDSGRLTVINQLLLPARVVDYALVGDKLWLTGEKLLLSYLCDGGAESGAAHKLWSLNEQVFVSAVGPLLVSKSGQLRQLLEYHNSVFPLPVWHQRLPENKLLKALNLPLSAESWYKKLIETIALRDLNKLLAFCVDTIDRTSGLLLEQRIYEMMQEIEKRRWFMASMAVGNYYAKRTGLPNLYLDVSIAIHQYLWQGNRQTLLANLRRLAEEQSQQNQTMVLDKLALLYLMVAQELWQQAYDLLEILTAETASYQKGYGFLQHEIAYWSETIGAIAYGDSLKNSAPEEWFWQRLGTLLKNISESRRSQLIKECGGWLVRLRNM